MQLNCACFPIAPAPSRGPPVSQLSRRFFCSCKKSTFRVSLSPRPIEPGEQAALHPFCSGHRLVYSAPVSPHCPTRTRGLSLTVYWASPHALKKRGQRNRQCRSRRRLCTPLFGCSPSRHLRVLTISNPAHATRHESPGDWVKSHALSVLNSM